MSEFWRSHSSYLAIDETWWYNLGYLIDCEFWNNIIEGVLISDFLKVRHLVCINFLYFAVVCFNSVSGAYWPFISLVSSYIGTSTGHELCPIFYVCRINSHVLFVWIFQFSDVKFYAELSGYWIRDKSLEEIYGFGVNYLRSQKCKLWYIGRLGGRERILR